MHLVDTLGDSVGKNVPTMQEKQVHSKGLKISRRRKWQEIASIFAWEIPWTEEPGGLQFMGLQRVRRNLVTKQQQQPDFEEVD